MTRLKRRLLIGLGVILLLLVGLGFLTYQFYLSPTSYALQRAEAFLFRRMQVARLSLEGEYRFFFITNRRIVSTAGPVEERFGTEREETLKFGYFDVKIEPTLGLGIIINPTEWFQNEEIQLKAVGELDPAAFIGQMQTLVDKSPQRSLMVVVHGFREAFPSALRKTTFIGHVLDINSPVLLFDWPGNQGSSPNGYRRAHQVAKESAPDLARSLELTIRNIRPGRLEVLGIRVLHGANYFSGGPVAIFSTDSRSRANLSFPSGPSRSSSEYLTAAGWSYLRPAAEVRTRWPSWAWSSRTESLKECGR